jgi:hypothetical protein
MFVVYFAVKVLSACLITLIAVGVLSRPVQRILQRFVPAATLEAWWSSLKFTLVIVGVSGGVRIYELANHLNPRKS